MNYTTVNQSNTGVKAKLTRRQGRYERRMSHRAMNRQARCDAIGTVEDVFTINNLYKAGKDCCKGVRWKNSVQKFEARLLTHCSSARQKLIDGTWQTGAYTHFTINERGKTRTIDAPRINDRLVQKVLTREVLLPLYLPSMIYNNGASLPGKGYEFSKRMLRKDLRYHYRRYRREGWIIILDFSKFFPSVSHEELLKRHQKYILDPALRAIADDIVARNPGDRGMPLGVEPSQAEMIAMPSALDNFIKCQLSMKCAGHYMDDYYILVPPNQDPKAILDEIVKKAVSIKLTPSLKKTRIVPLTKSFRFCKAKYILTETGRVVTRANKTSVPRARRKIRAFKQKVDAGAMTYDDLWTSVNGMLAYLACYNEHNKILMLRRLFYKIYGFSCENIQIFRKKEKEFHEVHNTPAL